MNRWGDVVGRSSSRSGSTGDAFLYSDNGGMQTIPTRNSHDVAWSINDAGVVVGEGIGGGVDTAWIWSRADGYADLNGLIDPSAGVYLLRAGAINDRGWIAADGFATSNGEDFDYVLIPTTEHGGLELTVSRPRVRAGDRIQFDLSHGGEGEAAALFLSASGGTELELVRSGEFNEACRFQPWFRVPALPAGSLLVFRGFGTDLLGNRDWSDAVVLEVR